jgi:hypothetical protein
VRDTPSEPTHRLHFLCLDESYLQLLALLDMRGNIGHRPIPLGSSYAPRVQENNRSPAKHQTDDQNKERRPTARIERDVIPLGADLDHVARGALAKRRNRSVDLGSDIHGEEENQDGRSVR